MVLPAELRVAGRRPWETRFLDTLELWKFGDYKHYVSLDLLAYTFGISELLEGMDGSKVHSVFYEEGDLPKIAIYCQHDTATCAQLYRKMRGKKAIAHENIVYGTPLIFESET